ncbi:MAG: putative 2OG-Fe(II) oxygenase [Gammaproteobacteria bacterium]|nr:putative 2OG-Fe(II) oxygenase [Gammaproteobacteria bacterium]
METHSTLSEARRLHQAGRLGEAAPLYRAVLDAEPGNADALHLLGVLMTQIGEFREAVRCLEQAVANGPERAVYLASLAQALYRAGREADAAAVLERLVRLRPDSVDAFSDLGAVRQELGDLDGAVEAYNRALALSPGFARGHFNLGTALKRRGELGAATASLRRAIDLQPGEASYHATLAGYLLECDRPEAALAASDGCLAIAPRNLLALSFKAIALERLGRYDEARRLVDLEQMIRRRDVEPPAGYESLAHFNACLEDEILGHPTLSAEPARNATRFGRHTAQLLDNPSRAVAELGRLCSNAVAEYLNALPRVPGHPYLGHRPQGWKLFMWGVVMESQGHQLAHTHPDGWVSGVYYVKLPQVVHGESRDHAGWIEFGRPHAELTGPLEPRVQTICPREGMLVLFPSHVYHRTVPYQSDEHRISIAFDAAPRFA